MWGDSIGLASLHDGLSPCAQRYVDANGNVRNEGNVQVGVPQPFSLSYRSITPQEEQASNLLVTAALSASHIAYGSIRMEPVFLTTGQAGGMAAALAIDGNTSVQDLDYQLLRQRLMADGARCWNGRRIAQSRKPLSLTLDFNGLSAPLPKTLRYTSEGTGFARRRRGMERTRKTSWRATCRIAAAGMPSSRRPGAAPGKLQGTYSAARQNYRDFAGALDGEVWVSLLVQNPDADAKAGISLKPGDERRPGGRAGAELPAPGWRNA